MAGYQQMEMTVRKLSELLITLETYQNTYGRDSEAISKAVAEVTATIKAQCQRTGLADDEESIRKYYRGPGGPGRNEKYTSEMKDRILSLRRNGMTLQHIEEETGVPYSSIRLILKRENYS